MRPRHILLLLRQLVVGLNMSEMSHFVLKSKTKAESVNVRKKEQIYFSKNS